MSWRRCCLVVVLCGGLAAAASGAAVPQEVSAGAEQTTAARGADPGVRLEIIGRELNPAQPALTVEPGPLALRVIAPDTRRAWLYYQPDAGEVRRQFLHTPGPDSIVRWNVDAVTGGKLYVAAEYGEGSSAKRVTSPAIRVTSGAYVAVERALAPDPRVRIEVNLPAFELSVYRENELLRRFRIGIGRKGWPVPQGLRIAREMVWNPDWVPPESPWATPSLVRSLKARGEVLGRLKIPLGGEILIHGTSRRSDLGRLVSHGCIRMLNSDLAKLADLLVRETAAPAEPAKIRRAKANKRFSYGVTLPRPVAVAIRYEPVVLRAGKVTVHRDVYGWAPVTPEQVAEAQSFADPVAPAAKQARQVPGRVRRPGAATASPRQARPSRASHPPDVVPVARRK